MITFDLSSSEKQTLSLCRFVREDAVRYKKSEQYQVISRLLRLAASVVVTGSKQKAFILYLEGRSSVSIGHELHYHQDYVRHLIKMIRQRICSFLLFHGCLCMVDLEEVVPDTVEYYAIISIWLDGLAAKLDRLESKYGRH